MSNTSDELRVKMDPKVVAHIHDSAALVGMKPGEYIERVYLGFLLGREANAEITATLKGVNLLIERGTEERIANAEARERMAG